MIPSDSVAPPAGNSILKKARSLAETATGEEITHWFKWFGILLAGALTAASHHWFNPDFMSYLDIGAAWLRRDFAHAANGYWFPVFPILSALMAKLFPDNSWNPIAGHLLNFLIFLVAQGTFVWLLRQAQEFVSAAKEEGISRELAMFGFPVYWWCELVLTSPESMGTDTLVGISLMAATGVVLRIANRGATPTRFAALGLALGLGYLTKIIMLSVGSVFLIGSLFLVKPFRRAIALTALAGVVFAAVNAPHIAYLSKLKGRLDLGDTGKLAYAWLVNDVSPLFHWIGEPPGFGVPKHPPRRVIDDPEVFDYSSYPFGTYPPGYDPSYWNEGLKSHFNFSQQIKAIKEGLMVYAKIFLRPGPILLLAALCLGLRGISWGTAFKRAWELIPVFLASGAGLTLYLLVLVDLRYVGFLLLIGLIALFATLSKTREAAIRSRAFEVLCALGALVLAAGIVRDTAAAPIGRNQKIFRDHMKIAALLREHGLKPGDKIGVIGKACVASYAQLTGTQIIAEGCTFHHEEWLEDAAKRDRAVTAMLPLGVKAIVLDATPANLDRQKWLPVPGASYSILFIQ